MTTPTQLCTSAMDGCLGVRMRNRYIQRKTLTKALPTGRQSVDSSFVRACVAAVWSYGMLLL